jgi:hypothetical protein
VTMTTNTNNTGVSRNRPSFTSISTSSCFKAAGSYF